MAGDDEKNKSVLRPQFAAYPVTAISGLKIGAAVTTIIVSTIEYSYGVQMSEKLVAAIQEITSTVCIVGVLFVYDAIRRYFKTRSTDVLGEGGMTLIELLVVIGIISTLAAIALPGFMAYRRNALNVKVDNDIRNIKLAEEAYFSDANSYTSSIETLKQNRYGFNATEGVTLTIEADASTYSVRGKVAGCAGEMVYSQQDGRTSGRACE